MTPDSIIWTYFVDKYDVGPFILIDDSLHFASWIKIFFAILLKFFEFLVYIHINLKIEHYDKRQADSTAIGF